MTDATELWQKKLAAFIAAPEDVYLSPAAVDVASLALADYVGVTLAGAVEPIAEILTGYCAAHAVHDGPAVVIGTGFRTSAPEAALANAVIGHILDYDDSNFVLGGHPSVPIFPAVLALAQSRRSGGKDVLEAYLVGFEAMTRVARAVNFHHYEKGWHPTSTLGIFGAAAACSYLLGLNESQSSRALSLAAAMSSGMKSSFGTMAKPFQVGRASQSGLVAALMAQAGMSAPETGLEAGNGFFHLYNGAKAFKAEALAGSGQPEILASGLKFKRYPCCGSTHVVIDAVKVLREQVDLSPQDVRKVEVLINPRRLPHVDRPVIADSLDGKFSIQFTAAAALVDGDVGLAHFTAEALTREDLAAMVRKISVGPVRTEAEGLSQPCRVTVWLADGSEQQVELAGPHGRETAAFRSFMPAKFMDCASRVLDPDACKDILERLAGFAALTDINPFMQRLGPEPEDRAAPGGDRHHKKDAQDV